MTLRRFVQFSRDMPMIAVVSKPHWKSDFLFCSNDELCRYFLPSEKFTKKFGNISKFEVIEKIKSYTFQKKGGSIGTGEVILADSNGESHSFEGESFFNTFDVLTPSVSDPFVQTYFCPECMLPSLLLQTGFDSGRPSGVVF